MLHTRFIALVAFSVVRDVVSHERVSELMGDVSWEEVLPVLRGCLDGDVGACMDASERSLALRVQADSDADLLYLHLYADLLDCLSYMAPGCGHQVVACEELDEDSRAQLRAGEMAGALSRVLVRGERLRRELGVVAPSLLRSLAPVASDADFVGGELARGLTASERAGVLSELVSDLSPQDLFELVDAYIDGHMDQKSEILRLAALLANKLL